jgi:hypothetical protein
MSFEPSNLALCFSPKRSKARRPGSAYLPNGAFRKQKRFRSWHKSCPWSVGDETRDLLKFSANVFAFDDITSRNEQALLEGAFDVQAVADKDMA